jgi:hypothetical protein
MWSFSRDAVAAVGIIGCFILVAAIGRGGDYGREPADDGYETTGSIGGANRAVLPLSEEQRARIHQGLLRFPDAARMSAPVPMLADTLSAEQPLQDIPAPLTQEIPLLSGHKFVKLSDRILLVDAASRKVVALIPRYRLLP